MASKRAEKHSQQAKWPEVFPPTIDRWEEFCSWPRNISYISHTNRRVKLDDTQDGSTDPFLRKSEIGESIEILDDGSKIILGEELRVGMISVEGTNVFIRERI
jgi:hypothetical protein